MKYKVIMKSAVSCSIELTDAIEPYLHEREYDVYVNGKLSCKQVKTNVFSVYELMPGAVNHIKVAYGDESDDLEVETEPVSEIIEIEYDGQRDYTKMIQDAIDGIKPNGLIIIGEGMYDVHPLFLKSKITLLLKGTLLGSINRQDYPILDEYRDGLPLGTWEGNVMKMFASLITGINIHDVKLVGPGTLDGNAQNGDWWVNHKQIRGAARPRTIHLNHCQNIEVEGLTIRNSPAWTIHPYYSVNVRFIDLKVINPKISPNTDGCNPESCHNVEIIGCYFSVGDDCIAIKSGKMEMVEKYYRPSDLITIRNCLMENGHGAIVLGSETSSGVSDLDVEKCLFVNTDRGLRIKTRRGRGSKTVIDGIMFRDIKMDHVLNPFVINMFYHCDADGKSEYVQSKERCVIDERTPYLGHFKFQNIICQDAIISAAFFYGLPEVKIARIEFENVTITMAPSEEFGYPAMMGGIEPVNRLGCYFNNVKEVVLNNVQVRGQIGEEFIFNNVDRINGKEN